MMCVRNRVCANVEREYLGKVVIISCVIPLHISCVLE